MSVTTRTLSARLPLLLLLLALSTVVLFGGDRGHFYRPGHHANVSAFNLAIAANFSPDHGWLMFPHRWMDADGRVQYHPYNRYPFGTYALTKLAILPFADDLSAQISAARFLMLMFFAAAAVLAYWSLCRLTASRWVALAAVLLAFSSAYCLYYSDLVSIEPAALFGVMLTFHGMVLFAQGGGFRQLLVRACLALFLGAWNVYALLLPFIVLGLASELWRHRRASHVRSVGSTGGLWAFGRYIALGAVALLFGASFLAFNLHNEYTALGGEVPLEETPTFESVTVRLDLPPHRGWTASAEYAEYLDWPAFLKNQLHRVGGMSVPFVLENDHLRFEVGTDLTSLKSSRRGALIGLGVLGTCLLALCRLRHKVLLATLVSSGFCWALPLRRSVFIHDSEAIFYVGIPMVFYASMLLYLHRRLGNRIAAACAGVALIVFASSSLQGVRLGRDADEAERQSAMIADFEAVRGIVAKDQSVVGTSHALRDLSLTFDGSSIMFYLTGRIVNLVEQAGLANQRDFAKARESADFVITTKRAVYGWTPLTPDNTMVFLHRRAGKASGSSPPSRSSTPTTTCTSMGSG